MIIFFHSSYDWKFPPSLVRPLPLQRSKKGWALRSTLCLLLIVSVAFRANFTSSENYSLFLLGIMNRPEAAIKGKPRIEGGGFSPCSWQLLSSCLFGGSVMFIHSLCAVFGSLDWFLCKRRFFAFIFNGSPFSCWSFLWCFLLFVLCFGNEASEISGRLCRLFSFWLNCLWLTQLLGCTSLFLALPQWSLLSHHQLWLLFGRP